MAWGCLAGAPAPASRFFALVGPNPYPYRELVFPKSPAEPGAPLSLTAAVRRAIRVRHYSRRTEQSYVAWVRRYVRFHGLRHPRELDAGDVNRFLAALAEREGLSASSQAQALSALLFLYRDVLEAELDGLEAVARAKQPSRLPVVLDREEVRGVLGRLTGTPRIVALLLYGSGLRLLESLQLRVKDLDFAMGQIVVRRAKGGKDRVTMLPGAAVTELEAHLARVRRLHRRDLASGGGGGPRRCPRRSAANRPARPSSGGGSTSSRHGVGTRSKAGASGGIICTSRSFSGR